MAPPKDDEQDWMPEGVAGDDSWMPEGIEGDAPSEAAPAPVVAAPELAPAPAPEPPPAETQPNYYPVQMLPQPSMMTRFIRWVDQNADKRVANAIGESTGLSPDTIAARTRGVLDFLSAGHADEAVGWLESKAPARLSLPLSDVFNEDVPTPPARTYQQARDAQREVMERTAAARPLDYYGAGVGASLMAPGPRLGTGITGAVKTGALMGGIGGAGASEADLLKGEFSKYVDDIGAGARFGSAGGAAMQALGTNAPRAAEKFSDWLADSASIRALKSVTGRNQRLWEKLLSEDMAKEIGRDLLDEGVVTAGASVDEARRKAASVAERAGKDIDLALKEVDALIPEDARPWSYDIAQDIERRMVEPRKVMSAGDEGIARRLQMEANKFRNYQFPTRPTLERLEQQKRYLDPFIDHEAQKMVPMQNALDDLRDYLANNVEQSAWQAASEAGSNAAERFVEAKRLYGNMAAISAPSLKQSARELSNRILSPSDHGLGGIGALMSQQQGAAPVEAGFKGAALALANKVFRERGNQVAAVGMDRLSSSEALQRVMALNPQALGEYGRRLTEAAARGGEGAIALEDYMLAQTVPEYAELRRKALMEATGQNPSP